ncbi:MAG TPA: hypothetical protein VMH02_08900 [Verrucomicrobiae bacterium]|nr:hypothetical protein [Verrucomicrobiae bacterium]
MILALFALLLVVAEYFGLLSTRSPRTPVLPAWSWVATLLASYAIQLGIVLYAAQSQFPVDAWRSQMPIPVLDDRSVPMANPDLLSGAMLALAALQAYALLALYRAQPGRKTLWIGCGIMLAMSFFAPALISFDLYGYVHDAVLGYTAYNPPNVPFQGDYRFFDLWWQGPVPSFYGPLWPLIVRAATVLGPTLFWKIVSLRALSVLLYVALLFTLRALRLPRRILVVAALNPGMMLQYVANGHNDMIAIVLLTLSVLFVRTRLPLALALIAIAGLVKIPYLALGMPVLAAVRPLPARVAWAALTIAAAAALSWFGGGAPYVHALLGHVGQKAPSIAQYASGAVALILIAMAFFGMRRYRTAPWILPTISSWIFAWYFIWGLPYALARHRVAGFLLVAFPFAAMLVESSFQRWWVTFVVIPAVALVWFFTPAKGEAPARAKAAT